MSTEVESTTEDESASVTTEMEPISEPFTSPESEIPPPTMNESVSYVAPPVLAPLDAMTTGTKKKKRKKKCKCPTKKQKKLPKCKRGSQRNKTTKKCKSKKKCGKGTRRDAETGVCKTK